MDDNLLDHFRKFYDAPAADNEAVQAETEQRFVRNPDFLRKQFVDGLAHGMLNDEIGLRERSERMNIHRRFNTNYQNLRRLGR
jgi:hypothetical protein